MQEIYEFGDFRLETAEQRLTRNGSPIPLAPKVFDTLVALVENPGRLLPKYELMQKLWPNTFVEEVSLAQNISQLRKALGDSAGEGQMIQTVAKRGYRFAAPVRVVTAGQPSNATILLEGSSYESPVPEHSRRLLPEPAPARWKAVTAAAAAALVIVTVSYLVFSVRIGKATATPAVRSIAVLPLANLSTDPAQEFFADGMTDDLITELARIHALRVISRTSVMQYKGTRKTLPQIARELNVDALVEGTISQRNGQIHITTQLVRANPEQHIWAESYERPREQAQNLQSEIVREIAGALKTSMTPEEQAWMRKSRTTNPEANLLYLKGRYFWNKRTREGVREGEKYFQQAITKDGDFAQAYVGLAGVYVFEGGWGMEPATVVVPRAEAAAQKAIALDSENAAAHATLGLIAMNYEWDWGKAEREYKLALRLNPNDSVAHHWYAEYLGAQGRLDEGLAEMGRAQQLDPLSLMIATDEGKLLYFCRRYDQAIEQLRKTLEMDPGFVQASYWLVRAYSKNGMRREAGVALEAIRQMEGDNADYWLNVSMAKAMAGRREEATDAAAKVKLNAANPPDPAMILALQIARGDKNEAFTWMEKCYATHSTAMTSLKVNPDYDNLRSDPRFTTYLERVGLSN
jgi:TolB-like protein/DNA-binding winged helix-turn-helix (wHTH) protein/Tfp pilus assembly protein PilF